ncbi:MAG: metallophosphoesterase [Candidatus Eremiobacteraeota bacterium]|nr:metallophosphoesterase [Candidatus Eremiobacteraeota bacterium]
MRIWHTADLHDHRGIAPRLRALRAARPGLLFDCGDALRGSQTIYHRSEPIIDELAKAGYDAQAMGNHEFHYLFSAVRARASHMRYPLLCANVTDVRGRRLPFVTDMTFQSDADGEGWTVRVFGLMVVQYPKGSPWERVFGWRFLPPVEVARAIADDTPVSTTLVLLSHLGLKTDRVIAQAVPRLDLILGGHSHDTLYEPEGIGGVPIVHAGPYGAYVSCTEFEATARRPRVARSSLVPLLASTG